MALNLGSLESAPVTSRRPQAGDDNYDAAEKRHSNYYDYQGYSHN